MSDARWTPLTATQQLAAGSRPPPWGTMSKLEAQTILNTDERSIHLELGREGPTPTIS
jgi:hypothetical protein